LKASTPRPTMLTTFAHGLRGMGGMGLAKRGISTTYRAARRSACALLSPFERRSLRRAALEHLSPPLFVVGAPRTGTTLF